VTFRGVHSKEEVKLRDKDPRTEGRSRIRKRRGENWSFGGQKVGE